MTNACKLPPKDHREGILQIKLIELPASGGIQGNKHPTISHFGHWSKFLLVVNAILSESPSNKMGLVAFKSPIGISIDLVNPTNARGLNLKYQ